jgi:hypothetical protein
VAPDATSAEPRPAATPDAGSRDRRRPPRRRPGTVAASRPVAGSSGGKAARGYGTLDLSSDPWAEIAIDGVAIGKNTPLRGFPVAAGRHRVTLHNPHFDITKTIVVEVAPGARTRRVVDLTAR